MPFYDRDKWRFPSEGILNTIRQNMASLLSLPYEVLLIIAEIIAFDDVYNLSFTCKRLRFLTTAESTAKAIVQSKIPFSKDAQLAANGHMSHAKALRQFAQRKAAFVNGDPFAAVALGYADSWLYRDGVLCYIHSSQQGIRVLDLHNSAAEETFIYTPGLLCSALHELVHDTTGNFQLLYYSHDIISCLYRPSGGETRWLIAFHLKLKKVLLTIDVDASDKIFVRSNADFLYYGVHSEWDFNERKTWTLHGYSLKTERGIGQVHLENLVGSDIGSTICFEICSVPVKDASGASTRQDYLYAVSNQTSFDDQEIDWTSYYHCARFPLDSPSKEFLEVSENEEMWRRQHDEGPTDDRWTKLTLAVDEGSGELYLHEARKEWDRNTARSLRKQYRTQIIFRSLPKGKEVSWATMGVSNSGCSSKGTVPNASHFPPGSLTQLISAKDDPHYTEPKKRLPENVHHLGDDPQKPLIFSRTPVQFYNLPASAHLDLIDDPRPDDWRVQQRLRIKFGSRKKRPPQFYSDGTCANEKGLLRPEPRILEEAMSQLYQNSPTILWPAEQDPSNPSAKLDAVYELLNPTSYVGEVEGVADERSLIYSTGGVGTPKALIFVSFDPAIKLAGLKRFKKWGGPPNKGLGEGPHIDGRARGVDQKFSEHPPYRMLDRALGQVQREELIDHSADEQPVNPAGFAFEGHTNSERGSNEANNMSENHWIWMETAQYRHLGVGFDFGS